MRPPPKTGTVFGGNAVNLRGNEVFLDGSLREGAVTAGDWRRMRYYKFVSLPKACGCNIRWIYSHSPAAAKQILRDAVSPRHCVPAPSRREPFRFTCISRFLSPPCEQPVTLKYAYFAYLRILRKQTRVRRIKWNEFSKQRSTLCKRPFTKSADASGSRG